MGATSPYAKVAGIFDALDDAHLRALPLAVKNNLIFTLNADDFLARNDRIQGEYTNAERLLNMANLPLDQITTQSMVLLLGALNALSGSEIATLGSARLVALINTVTIDFSLVPDDKIVDILVNLPTDVIPQLQSAKVAGIFDALDDAHLRALPLAVKNNLIFTLNADDFLARNDRIQGMYTNAERLANMANLPLTQITTQSMVLLLGALNALSGTEIATLGSARLVALINTVTIDFSLVPDDKIVDILIHLPADVIPQLQSAVAVRILSALSAESLATLPESLRIGLTTSYTVTPSAGTNGSLSPATAQSIAYGNTASFIVTPASGYGIATATGCNGGLSGKTYTTGPVVANCLVNVTFSASAVNGACGSDNRQTNLTATPSNLCTTGAASLVYGSGPWNWTCAGSNGGSTASCSAAASSYAVTASVSGTGGTISPASPASRTVVHNGVTTFTVSPSIGYAVNTVSGCGGSLSGTLYTTSAVTAACVVSATFSATNTTTAITTVSPSPSKKDQTVTVSYSVTGPATGGDTVTVKDSTGSPLCTGTLTAGAGSCSASFSSSGAKTLIAHYTPSGAAQASASPGKNHLVADSPALATPTLPSGVVGVPYATMLVASGGAPPYTFTATGLPTGFNLSTRGLLSGTASAVAAPTVRITVTDSLAQSADQDYSLTLVAQLTVATTSLPVGLVNAPYDQTLLAVGGKTPYVWSVISGALPGGLTLNPATGQLSGTPTNLGSSDNFTVQTQDVDARTATQVLSLTTQPPTVTKTGSGTASGTTLSANFAPSNGGSTCTLDDSQTRIVTLGDIGATSAPPNSTLPYGLFKMTVQGCTPGQTKLSVKLVYPVALPPGTQYWKYGKTAANPTDHWYVLPSAVITGNTVSFSITDGGLGDDDLTADGSITDPGGAGSPTLAIGGTPGSGQVGSGYSATLTPSNGTGPVYNWSLASGGLPAGVTLNATTGQLSGTPTTAGTFNFSVKLVDTSDSASKTQAFAVTIASASLPPTDPGPGVSSQTITFGSAPVLLVGSSGTLSASASSGLPVTLSSATPDTCTVTGNTVVALAVGTCTVNANQPGNAHYNAAAQVTQSIAVGKAVSATRLTADPVSPALAGQTTTLTVRVSGAAGTPSGNVVFKNAESTLGTVSLDGSGGATYAGNLGIGLYALTVRYTGDAAYLPSLGSLSYRVADHLDTTLSVRTQPNLSQPGESVPVSVSVTPARNVGTLSGTVDVSSDGQSCRITLPETRCTLVFARKGVKALSATYSGNNFYSAATGSGRHFVGQRPNIIPSLSVLLD